MGRFDPVALLEATSSWVPDEAAWLAGIAHATRGLDLGGGRVVYTLRFHSAEEPPALVAAEDGAPGWPDELARLNQAFSPASTALVHVPSGQVRSHGPRVVLENATRTGMTYDEYMERAGPGAEGPPLADFVHGGSGPDRVSFFAIADRPRTLRPERKRVVAMFIAHFAAMARLRRYLRADARPDDADAVLDARGRLLHATDDAASARESLTDAVLRADRARGAMRRRDPEGAIAVWRALVAGRYTLVESVERDGKRLLLARRNPPGMRGLSAPDPSEAACAYFTALGHPQKLIAYGLGLSTSAAARLTRSALAKLRLPNAEALVAVIGPLLPPLVPERRRKRSEIAKRLAAAAAKPLPGFEVFDVGPPRDGWVIVAADAPSVAFPELPTALREVLAMVLRGETNRTIASLRGTSLRTVENQVSVLLRRFGARSRVDLVRLAVGTKTHRPRGRATT